MYEIIQHKIEKLISLHDFIKKESDNRIIQSYSNFLQQNLNEFMFIGAYSQKLFEFFERDGLYVIEKSSKCIHRDGLGWQDKTIEDLVKYQLTLTNKAKEQIYGF